MGFIQGLMELYLLLIMILELLQIRINLVIQTTIMEMEATFLALEVQVLMTNMENPEQEEVLILHIHKKII